MNWAPAMNGVAATTNSEVERFAQTSSGIRQKVIPGARMVMIVTRKFSAVGDRGGARELDAEVEEGLAQRGAGGERRVARPAGVEGAAGGKTKLAHEEQAGERQHPEAERVEARKGHVRRADHQRQDVVGRSRRRPESRRRRSSAPRGWRRGCCRSPRRRSGCPAGRARPGSASPSGHRTKKKKKVVTMYWMPITLWSVLTLK